jgi:hypothetical protein
VLIWATYDQKPPRHLSGVSSAPAALERSKMRRYPRPKTLPAIALVKTGKPNFKKASSALGTERRPAEEAQANVFEKLPAFLLYWCAKQTIRYTFSQNFLKITQNHHNLAKNSQKNNAGGF